MRTFAVLVFAWQADRVVICDIEDRGWCIPSGRVEPEETSLEAAHREAMEEGGVELDRVQYIGCYQISERREVRWADCFAAKVKTVGQISMTEESHEMRLVTLEELPAVYHLWNPLTEAVFKFSQEVVQRLNDSRCK